MKKVTEEFAQNNPPAYKIENEDGRWFVYVWQKGEFDDKYSYWAYTESFVFKRSAKRYVDRMLNKIDTSEYYVK